METNFSVYQELFLSSHIRREVKRLQKLVLSYRVSGLDTSILKDNIFELKTLYRQLFGISYID